MRANVIRLSVCTVCRGQDVESKREGGGRERWNEKEREKERASEREREEDGRGERETEIKRERMCAFKTLPTLVYAHTCTCVFSNGESSLRAVSPANGPPLLSSPLRREEPLAASPSRLYSTRASARHRFFPPAPPPRSFSLANVGDDDDVDNRPRHRSHAGRIRAISVGSRSSEF